MAGNEADTVIGFADIVQRYNRYLYNYLRRLAGDSAEDLLQETLLRVSQNFSDLKDVGNAKAWLFRIATNVAMDHFRSRRVEISLDDDEETEIPDSNSRDAADSYIIEEMNACIAGVIEKLPPVYRSVMLLYHFEALSISEVGAACDISPSAVKVRLHRGRELLKKALHRACDFYYDADSTLRCSAK